MLSSRTRKEISCARNHCFSNNASVIPRTVVEGSARPDRALITDLPIDVILEELRNLRFGYSHINLMAEVEILLEPIGRTEQNLLAVADCNLCVRKLFRKIEKDVIYSMFPQKSGRSAVGLRNVRRESRTALENDPHPDFGDQIRDCSEDPVHQSDPARLVIAVIHDHIQ